MTPETLKTIVALSSQTQFQKLQLAHTWARLDAARQFTARTRFRVLHIRDTSSKIYEYRLPQGKRDGIRIILHAGGKYHQSAYFINGVQYGNHITWFVSGQLFRREAYFNGVRHGECVEMTRYGQAHIKCNYRNGKLHGTWILFRANRQPIIHEYINGYQRTKRLACNK